MKRPFRQVLRHPLTQNTLAISAVHAATLGLPLLSIPYLARVLSPHAWGLFVLAQSLGLWLGALIEYGFSFSATREVARHRHDPGAVSRIVAGVLAARLGLASAAVTFALVLSLGVDGLRDQPAYLLAALILAIGFGTSSFWYFQGIERVRLAGSIEVGTRGIGVLLIFFFVDKPGEGALALMLSAAGAVLGSVLTAGLMYRGVAFLGPRLKSAAEALRMGWSIFLFRAGVAIYTSGNAVLLGLFVAPRLVGYYGGADKMVKAAVFLLSSVTLALYPRVSYLVSRDPERARRLALLGLALCVSLGVLMGAGMAIFAPTLTQLVLGADLLPAADLLRIMAVVPPLVGLNSVLAFLWILPMGWDQTLNRLSLGGGLMNLIVAVLLAPRLAGAGVSWAVVCTELTISISMLTLVRRRGFISPGSPLVRRW